MKKLVGLLFLVWSALALAQYPTKPVKIVVAAGPGAGDDFAARQLAQKMKARADVKRKSRSKKT